MRKKESYSKYTSIKNVLLYREDIEEIIQIFESKGLDVLISDSGFEYNELDEIINQRGHNVKQLELSGKVIGEGYGSISVSLDKIVPMFIAMALVHQESCGTNW